ncbi:hypothetical protein C8Q75DRAFT_719916, partial [Abortiporus biennis]
LSCNQEALRLTDLGDYIGAERQHKRAIQVKESSLPKYHTSIGISCNGLGEVYILMNRLDDAEHYLLPAIELRKINGPIMDLAISRDNLGKVYEMRGDLAKAREIRLQDAPNNMCCSNYTCTGIMQVPLSRLSRCGKCKSIFYCSQKCQSVDWKRHKKYCRQQ